MKSLEEIRKEIDLADEQIAAAFCKRMRAVGEIAAYKKERGLPVYDAAREEDILRRADERVADEELRGYYRLLQKDLMDISRAYQQKVLEGMKIAYCGTAGAFAALAVEKLFPNASAAPFGDFAAAYRAVESGECDSAVLPVENSFAGEVGVVCDLLFSGSLYINRVMMLDVTQNLLAPKGSNLQTIKRVVSHPQALAQCASFLKKQGYEQTEFSNTALAAKYVAEQNDPTLAAIGTREAGVLFGLETLAAGIQDSNRNSTRFVVLSRTECTRPRQEDDCFFMVFTVKNQAGALAKAIRIIGDHGFNMRGLHSRPMRSLVWQYYFYLECEGNIRSAEGQKMLEELQSVCDKLKVVGSYSCREGETV